ncbi:MAG: polyphosphate polymerase domain-containing protein [Candidatus Omnitrophica bacterium]|nr:polyphosphate polymerase domain-containing protein [Candidatus Omnitrophota bacterium]
MSEQQLTEKQLLLARDRVEVKYFFPLDKIEKLISYISPFMKADQYARGESNRACYRVGSVYFDGLDKDYYWSHVEGYPHRRKVRIRQYGLGKDEVFFLEVKEKMFVSSKKYRWVLDRALVDKIKRCLNHQEFYSCLEQSSVTPEYAEMKRSIGFDVVKYRIRPVLFVDFMRMPFVSKEDSSLRLTVDYDIQASQAVYPLFLGHAHRPKVILSPHASILELKLNGRIPKWMEDILLTFDLRRTAFSKYRASADKLYNLYG